MSQLYSEELQLERTDPRLWRLRVDELGRESWEYISEEESKNDRQSTFVQWLLGVPTFPTPTPRIHSGGNDKSFKALEACKNGANFYQLLQDPVSGIFPCQYKGPMFMTIGYIVVQYVAGIEIPKPKRLEMIRYLANTSHPVDGGWGLHASDKSTVFGTAINYVNLRLLGLSRDHPLCTKARRTLHRLGGALGSPHWGKIWLSVLNLYKWEGVNPAPPETWLLPFFLPVHPGRWWVHTRAIYLPVSYLSLIQYQCHLTPLLQELREELYVEPFESIDFAANRNTVCGVDLYYPHSKFLDLMNYVIVFYEKYFRFNWIFNMAKNRVYDLIKKEISNTDFLCIAPVNQAFCALVTLIEEGKNSPQFQRFQFRFNDSLFHGPQGMTVMGTNGVQTWDCAFTIQSFFIAGLAEKEPYYDTVVAAFKFLNRAQFESECVPGSFRDSRIGAWGFSTKTQGYTVSDCTAEAIKAIIMVKKSPFYKKVHDLIDDRRLCQAIDVLLSLQNVGPFEYGSFATYEMIKAPLLMEKLNPAEVFGNIMVEYPYVECTDSAVLGLTSFRDYCDYRQDEINNRIKIAIDYIKRSQSEDGSWYGCWGVCFTYAGMFALEALSSVGEDYYNSEVVQKGCDFLVDRQMEDGGWSETMKSCELHSYVEGKKSMVVQTSWAIIALLLSKYPDKKVIDRAIKFLEKSQKRSGEWRFDGTEGVFNHSCAIEYPNYRFIFPIKALGLYANAFDGDTI